MTTIGDVLAQMGLAPDGGDEDTGTLLPTDESPAVVYNALPLPIEDQ